MLQKATKLQLNVLILAAVDSCFSQEPGKHICLFPERPERLRVSLTVELFNAWWGKKFTEIKGPENEADNLLPLTADFTTE
jgi:hypothetical protein